MRRRAQREPANRNILVLFRQMGGRPSDSLLMATPLVVVSHMAAAGCLLIAIPLVVVGTSLAKTDADAKRTESERKAIGKRLENQHLLGKLGVPGGYGHRTHSLTRDPH